LIVVSAAVMAGATAVLSTTADSSPVEPQEATAKAASRNPGIREPAVR